MNSEVVMRLIYFFVIIKFLEISDLLFVKEIKCFKMMYLWNDYEGWEIRGILNIERFWVRGERNIVLVFV